ncbi:MAG: hypothetical protein Q9165_005041 [Trypethelium subeluteriae]
MPNFGLLLTLARFLLTPALISTLWIYFYPFLHGCEFPEPPLRTSEPEVCYLNPQAGPGNASEGHNGATGGSRGGLLGLGKQLAHTWKELREDGRNKLRGRKAPFRLLALGDPQLEGDTSLPDPDEPTFQSLKQLFEKPILETGDHDRPLRKEVVGCIHILESFRDLVVQDVPRLFSSWRKKLDLWGNDYYLAHVYRSMKWWATPTHVTVLGDLVGSQWIDDNEFEWRAWRYWNRVFSDGQKIEDSTALGDGSNEPGDELGVDKVWENRIINIAGNHDIGYAGEIDGSAIDRFETHFGRVNWDRWFRLPRVSSDNNPQTSAPPNPFDSTTPKTISDPAIRVVVLNDMNLDGPVYSHAHQSDTYSFINSVISTSRPVEDSSVLTVLLTHVPLHKQAGVCIDAPYFSYYVENAGLLREQNHLSEFASQQVLQSIFGMSGDRNAPGAGMGRTGIILDGHDHEGCDVWHYFNRSDTIHTCEESTEAKTGNWAAVPYPVARRAKLPVSSDIPGIREVTVRSMMGSYGGNAGLLSAWYEEGAKGGEAGEWKVEYAACPFVVQHVWWAVHIIDLILLGLILAAAVSYCRHWGSTRHSEGQGLEQEGNAEPNETGRGDGEAKVKMPMNGSVKLSCTSGLHDLICNKTLQERHLSGWQSDIRAIKSNNGKSDIEKEAGEKEANGTMGWL